jgi:TRAP transporter TAXI family solute receptor
VTLTLSVVEIEEERMRTKRGKLQRRVTRLRWPALLVGLMLIAGCFAPSAAGFEILLGTGPERTFSHYAGRMICRQINQNVGDLECRVVAGPDGVDNLTNLRGGSIDIGLVDSRMFSDALAKRGNFAFFDISYANLRPLLYLYNKPILLVVRGDADIFALADLKGKRFNTGPPRSPQQLAVATIMGAKGWTPADFSLLSELPASQSQDTLAFCHGTVQAMLHIGVHPDAALVKVLDLCQGQLVGIHDADIEQLVTSQAAFFESELAPGTYENQPAAVRTLATRVMLLAPQELDEETVYTIMAAIHSGRERLRQAHPALILPAMTAEQWQGEGVPLHPGAAKFKADHGD